MIVTENYLDNDELLSDHLCLDRETAKKYVQKLYFKLFLYHANRLKHKTSEFLQETFVNDYRIKAYNVKLGLSIPISDSLPSNINEKPSGLHDAWVWIIKLICKACCHYKSKNGASLSTYLNSVLSNRYTISQWEIHIYGDKRHVPSCLKDLSKQHIEIYKKYRLYMQYGLVKAKDKLLNELEIDENELNKIIMEIKKILLDNGKSHLLEDYYYVSSNKEDEDEQKSIEAKKNRDSIDYYITVFKKTIENLPTLEKDILKLKFYHKKNVGEIMDFFHSNNRIEELRLKKIMRSKDLYKFIDKILDKVLMDIENKLDHPVEDKKTAVACLYEILERRFE